MLNSIIQAEEQTLLKQMQKEYEVTASVITIQQQLNKEFLNDEAVIFRFETVEIKFFEWCWIAEAALSDASTFADQKDFCWHINLFINIITLCEWRKCQQAKINNSQEQSSVKMTEASIILLKSKSEKKHNVLLKCNSFQCLFCLTSVNLFLKNREQIYASKFFLQWHTDWCRFNKFKSDKKLPCFNNFVCAEVMLKGKMHFKNHAAQIHDFFLWVNNTWHQECIWDDLRCEIT